MVSFRLAAALALLLALGSGCGSGVTDDAPFYPSAPASASAEEPDSVLGLLRMADDALVRAAFAALDSVAYTRTTETVQFAPDGRARARHEVTVRHAAGADSSQLIGEARSGTFDLGWTGRLFGRTVDGPTASALGRHALPEEPAYLSPRSREAYTYRLLPDTTIGGRRTAVVDVTLRPGTSQAPSVRHARLYLDAATHAVLALDVTRADASAFFEQLTRTRLRLHPVPGNTQWLPVMVQTRTRFDGTMTAPQRLQTTSTFESVATSARPLQVRGQRLATHETRE